jgi:hypothetical protein
MCTVCGCDQPDRTPNGADTHADDHPSRPHRHDHHHHNHGHHHHHGHQHDHDPTTTTMATSMTTSPRTTPPRRRPWISGPVSLACTCRG